MQCLLANRNCNGSKLDSLAAVCKPPRAPILACMHIRGNSPQTPMRHMLVRACHETTTHGKLDASHGSAVSSFANSQLHSVGRVCSTSGYQAKFKVRDSLHDFSGTPPKQCSDSLDRCVCQEGIGIEIHQQLWLEVTYDCILASSDLLRSWIRAPKKLAWIGELTMLVRKDRL